MRKSLIRPTPTHSGENNIKTLTSDIQSVRVNLLNRVLLWALILEAPILAITLFPGKLTPNGVMPTLIYGFVFAWLVLIALGRQFSYRFRSISFILLIFIQGMMTLFIERWEGSGRLYLLAIPLLASMLFGFRAGFLGLIISGAVVASVSYLNTQYAPDVAPLEELPGYASFGLLPLLEYLLASGVLLGALCVVMQYLENSIRSEKSLADDLIAERSQLERRVQYRTQEFERRLTQWRKALELCIEFGSIVDPNKLLNDAPQLVRDGFDLPFVGLFMVDKDGVRAQLIASSQDEKVEAGLHQDHQAVDQSNIIGWSIQSRKARLCLDVNREWSSIEHRVFPIARSEMAVPLLPMLSSKARLSGAEVEPPPMCYGAMAFFSDQPMAFNTEDLLVFQTLADCLVIAYEKAQIVQQLRARVNATGLTSKEYLRAAWKRAKESVGVLSYVDEESNSQGEAGETEAFQVPIMLRDQVIGLLTLGGKKAERDEEILSSPDKAFIQSVIYEAAQALENVRLVEETQKRMAYERFLASVSQKLRNTSELDAILRVAVKEIAQGMGASEALIRLEIPQSEDEA